MDICERRMAEIAVAIGTGLGIDAALGEIERGRGTAYDAVVADACLKPFRGQGYAVPA